MLQELQLEETTLKRFASLAQRGRLAHSYLFVGPPDIGKGETALAIAKLVNCEDSDKGAACGACPSCVKAGSGNHPDIFVIDNGYGESIKIEQIREILDRNKLRAFLGGKKVFILRNMENLTLEGANAFLKTLEEPASDTLLILTTSGPDKILDTIKSRCHMVYFPSMKKSDLAEKLKDECGSDNVTAHILAYFAQGCFRTAKRLDEEQFTDCKNGVIDGFILRRPQDAEIKDMLGDKEETKEFLNIVLSWVRDAMLVKAGVEDERLVHLDRVADLRTFSARYSFKDLKNINEGVINMCQLLADNLNIKLPLLIIGEQLWEK